MTFFGTALRRRPLLLLGALGLAVCLALVAEVAARSVVAGRMADGAERRLKVRPEIRFGTSPVLLHLAEGGFPEVGVSGHDATFGDFSGISFDARLSDVERRDDGVSVRRSSVRADVGADALGADAGAVVEADPGAGVLVAHAGPGGLVRIPLTPALDGTRIELRPGEPTFDGTALPPLLADRVTEQAARTIPLTGLPLDLRPRSLSVTEDGLRLQLTGGPARFAV
ncbi:DUF2993 domain-containing protein [Streptomyces sp. NPDC051940]|uniref:LmeA family phospholipid-binding protein n=1 Tax=Streptomyces sp. NPDC051940 TaxID=3155675 RepID=UPI00343745F1